MQRFDFLGAESGNIEHGDQPGRRGGFEVLVIGEFAGGDEFGDLFLDGVADAFDLGQALFGDQFLQRFAERFEGAGGIRVGPGFEGILALQLQQHPNVFQNLRHLASIHDRSIAVPGGQGKQMRTLARESRKQKTGEGQEPGENNSS